MKPIVRECVVCHVPLEMIIEARNDEENVSTWTSDTHAYLGDEDCVVETYCPECGLLYCKKESR